MDYIVLFVFLTASAIISSMLACMFARVVLSLFFPESESGIAIIIYTITETIVAPVRILFAKLGWFQNIPIDMAFFSTVLILVLIQYILL